jgi:Uma2 family endonuclease
MTAVSVPQEQRVTLSCVPWEAYVGIGELLRDHPIRMTYDRGRLEIMTLSREHERMKKLLARLFEAMTEELNVPVEGGGSTTFQREDLERGLEPDECYWIEHEAQMRVKDDYDPDTDPPPDLALEVEFSRGINRINIYAALGIPEIWRCARGAVEILILQEDGRYQPSETSRSFPQVPVAELSRFLGQRNTLSVNDILREFREWVRSQIASGWATKKTRKGKRSRGS